MYWFLDRRIMLLKSLKVLGVGWRSEIIIVLFKVWVNWFKVFMMLNVVELLSFVEILFMKSVVYGFIIILFVVICFF